jgi:hypothetical protein
VTWNLRAQPCRRHYEALPGRTRVCPAVKVAQTHKLTQLVPIEFNPTAPHHVEVKGKAPERCLFLFQTSPQVDWLNWVPVVTEHVNWKTGGVLKSVFSEGIVKGDINGHIEGAGSVTSVGALDFLIKTVSGVDATDFQLVYLRHGRNAREFRRVTGGVFHVSGGSTRDEIEFGQTKIASQVYKITLPELQAREYAFLAPGIISSLFMLQFFGVHGK